MQTQRIAALAAVMIVGTWVGGRAADAPRPGVDWPSFHGIGGAGVGDGRPVVATFDVPAGRNVLWKTPLEGLGHSSPIIWGDLLCVTTAIGGTSNLKVGLYGDIESVQDTSAHTWKLVCASKRTGARTWERTITSGVPRIKRHPKSTHANSTPATDGTHIVVLLGSEGLHAFDMQGKPLWQKDLGVLDSSFYMAPEAQWEFASSPIIHDGVVLVQADVQKGSFLAAFDVGTGKELWRSSRQDVLTWSTPAIHTVGGRAQVLVNGWRHIGAYDFKTGEAIWWMKGGGDIPVPTPVVAFGNVIITNAHGPMAPIYAIREGARGDISLGPNETQNANVTWSHLRDGAYLISPVVYRGELYVSKSNGVIAAYDARTGERHYQQRLGDGKTGFTASIVAADGKVFFTSEDGDVYVVKAGPVFEHVATNPIGEVAMATPAVSEGAMFWRTRGHLVAIGEARQR